MGVWGIYFGYFRRVDGEVVVVSEIVSNLVL